MEKIKKIITNKYFIFFFAFVIMFICLLPLKDLFLGSMDSEETWGVVKTFFADDKYASYVMYKGLYAFVPGVICYYGGNLLNINPILLMKIFHSLSFAYIATIGLPYIIEYFFKKKILIWQRYLFILVILLLEYNLFAFISVDFISLAILLLCVNAIIKIKVNEKTTIPHYLYLGLILGILGCLSGQYSISALLLMLYSFYLIIKNNKKNLKKCITILIIFLLGFIVTKGLNKLYVLLVVDVLRESGAWIPTGMDWFHTGFTASMGIINSPYLLPDNLGISMITNEGLDLGVVNGGGTLFSTIPEMFNIIIHYPIIFISRWSERLYLGIVNDPYNYFPCYPFFSTFMTLALMGTMIYASLLEFKDKVKTIKDIFTYKILIVITFIFPALVPSMMGHAENRYYFGIRSLIIAVFCMSPFLPNVIGKLKKLNFKQIKNWKINYSFIFYLIFVSFIILLYIALYQSAGPNTDFTYEIF